MGRHQPVHDRAAAQGGLEALVEQSIGRGLRLPFGEKTDVAKVDRLTIVSHDKFNDIIEYANKPGSVIIDVVKLGSELVPEHMVGIEQQSTLEAALFGGTAFAKTYPERPTDAVVNLDAEGNTVGPTAGADAAYAKTEQARRERKLSVLATIERYAERQRSDELPNAEALLSPKHQAAIASQVARESGSNAQAELGFTHDDGGLAALVEEVSQALVQHTISIPKVIVKPKGEVLTRYELFEVDTSGIRFQPVQGQLRRQELQSGQVDLIDADDSLAGRESHPANYLLRKLERDYDDLSYQVHGEVMRDVSRQVVEHLRGYLPDEDAVHNVLQHYAGTLAQNLHAQLQDHYVEEPVEYEGVVTRGYTQIGSSRLSTIGSEGVLDYRRTGIPGSRMRQVVFNGFRKCLHDIQRFDNETERKFGVLLESDDQVERWFRPVRGQLDIYLPGTSHKYQPDFVVEARDKKWLCETKASNMMGDAEVLRKAAAARAWCGCASAHAAAFGGKAWGYLLVADDGVRGDVGWLGLARKFAS